MTVPSASDQKEAAKPLLNQPLQAGETWYVVDAKWYQRWKSYVKLEDNDNTGNAESPGPLDNSHLLRDHELKENLTDSQDYELVPEPLWEKLACWYGAKNEETIARKVIERGSANKECYVEVYFLNLTVSCYGSNNEKKLCCSRATTVEELKRILRKMFAVSEERPCQLWALYGTTSEIVKEPGEMQLGQLGLKHDHSAAMLEVQNDDGTWPKSVSLGATNSKTLMSTSSTTGSDLTNGYELSSHSSSRVKESTIVTPGLCGLSNLGNTCFMNSAIQCLSNVTSLTQYFLNGVWENEVNDSNPLGMHGKIARTYADVIKDIWSGRYYSTNPRSFKKAVGDFAPRFSGYQQQDSQELMAFLLDGLHEDLNRVKEKPYVEIKEASGHDDEADAAEAWKKYKQRNDSVIVDTFHGLLKSRLECPEKACGNVSVTFDPFCYLSLPIPQDRDKVMEVVFVPLDPAKRPGCYSVRVPKRGTVSDLCIALGKQLKLEPNQLTVTDVYNNKFHKIFTGDESLQHVSDKDDIYVYEKTLDERDCMVTVYLRERGPYTTRYIGVPQRVPLPSSQGVGYDQLYNFILNRLQSYEVIDSSVDDAESMASAGSPTIKKGEGYDERMDESTADDIATAGNSEGNTESKSRFKMIAALSSNYEEHVIECGSWLPKLSKVSHFIIEFDLKQSHCYKFDTQWEQLGSLDNEDRKAARGVGLSQCLDLFTQEEELGADDLWYCPRCKKHVRATKKFNIWSLPDVLVIHLKRFTYNRYLRDKIDMFIQYPVRHFNMSHWVTSSAHKETVYNLIAVSNHYGGLGGGHYTACAKNPNGRWYHFDDASVTDCGESAVVTKAGYLLIYEKVKHPSEGPSAQGSSYDQN